MLSTIAIMDIQRGTGWAYERVLEYWANTGQDAKLAQYLWTPSDDCVHGFAQATGGHRDDCVACFIEETE